MRSRLAMLVCGLLPALTPVAYGCSCAISGQRCGAFNSADTLFIGKVISVRIGEVNDGSFQHRQRMFRFEVSEAISGSVRSGTVVEVATGFGGGDCGYSFEIGASYFVDAYLRGDRTTLGTGICNETLPLPYATNLIREIHAIHAHERLPDLSGTIYAADHFQGPSPSHPLADIHVQLTPLAGNSYSTASDSDGIYTFTSLPPGPYRIDVSLPSNLVAYESFNRGPLAIQIPASGGVGAACHQDISALPGGSIDVQVIEEKNGASGLISLLKDGQSIDNKVSRSQNGDGHFTVNFVPPGRYRIVYQQFSPFRKTWFADEAHPDGVLVLQDGQHIEGLQIVVK